MAFISSFTPNSRFSSVSSSFTANNSSPLCPNLGAGRTATPKLRGARMLFGNFFGKSENVCLPQKDTPNTENRIQEIAENKEEYQWSYDMIGSSPMIKGLPKDEKPTMAWIIGIAEVVLRTKLNDIAIYYNKKKHDISSEKAALHIGVTKIISAIFKLMNSGQVRHDAVHTILEDFANLFNLPIGGGGDDFEQYKELYQTFKTDKVMRLNQFLDDNIFGWYRIAGPSPLHMTKLDKPVGDIFPELTDEILRGIDNFSEDTLSECAAQGRLFYVDYPEFEGVKAGSLPDGTPKEGFHVYAPTALFAVPKKVRGRNYLLPIAIRCGQGAKYPMYTANESHSNEVTWLAAKTTVQVADAVMHETRYHLGRTHLLLEIFVCAMKRSLAPNHPLSKFLENHFQGTAFINFLGSVRLAAPGGTIDVITAPPIELTTQLCEDAIKPPFRFEDLMPERDFALRGVLDPTHLHYPYRDDAMKLWNAILQWVGAYVRSYYGSDADVQADQELAAWCREIRDPMGGRFTGFGENQAGEVKTVHYLVKMIATMVFVGSAQHAALNFSQGPYMQFAPAMPLTAMSPAPTTAKPFDSEGDWVKKMLPPLGVAHKQLNTAEILSGFRYTTLGEYGKNLDFVSDYVKEAMEEFQKVLGEIGSEIQNRNAKERQLGLPVYSFLIPKNIPQSTNV